VTGELRLSVPAMTCDHCVAAVHGELVGVAGVIEVTVDLDTKAVVVVGDDVDRAAVEAAVQEAGYDAVF
jgi:copper chaperone